MCRRVECSSCGCPTYAGCGAHIEQVLSDVPADKRCKCREKKQSMASVASEAAKGSTEPSWLQRFLGK